MNNLYLLLENILKKYNADIEHSYEVLNYSKMIFTSLNSSGEFSSKEETYLYTAAMLHDIGYFIDKKSHHKHTFDLILQEKIVNFTNEEILIIANIARYHRGSLPNNEEHKNFAILSEYNKTLVMCLAGMLRLADGFDKPHKNLILRMRAEINAQGIVFFLKTIGFKPSLKAAEMKKNLLEYAYNKKVTLVIE